MACSDIKDFFLSGTPMQVSADVASLFEPPLSDLIRNVVCTLMESQYALASLLQELYFCVKGAGIGPFHSGFLTQLCFLRLCGA